MVFLCGPALQGVFGSKHPAQVLILSVGRIRTRAPACMSQEADLRCGGEAARVLGNGCCAT